MKKSKAKIVTSLELVGTPFNFADVIYREIPAIEGVLPYLRIDKVSNLIRVLKTEGFLGDFGDGHRFDFKIHRHIDSDLPPEIHTGNGEAHKITVFTGIRRNVFTYAIEGMSDGNLRITQSDDFLEDWNHTDIHGFLFTRVVL